MILQHLNTYTPHYSAGWKSLSKAFSKKNHSSFTPLSWCKKPVITAALALYTLATPLILAVDFSYTTMRNRFKEMKLDGNCHLLFKTDLIARYQLKLQKTAAEYASGKLSTKEKNLLRLINQDIKTLSIRQKREWYRAFTHALRSLSSEGGPISPFAKSLILALYLDLDFIDDLAGIAETGGPSLQESWKALKKKYRNEGNVKEFFDAHLFGNFPFSLGTAVLDQDHRVTIIRMPSVTKDINVSFLGNTRQVALIEQFNLFLHALKAENRQHLYVNLMSRQYGNERKRTELIENLDRDPKKPIHVLSLDKNSDFYKQTGPVYGSPRMNKQEFTQLFLEKLNDPKGRYYFPARFDRDRLAPIINDVALLQPFSHLDTLPPEDRALFIEQVYVRIIENAARSLHASSINISCLHCIDRGATQTLQFLSYLKQDRRPVSLNEKQMKALLFAPALMVSYRAVQPFYFNRACAFIDSSSGIL